MLEIVLLYRPFQIRKQNVVFIFSEEVHFNEFRSTGIFGLVLLAGEVFIAPPSAAVTYKGNKVQGESLLRYYRRPHVTLYAGPLDAQYLPYLTLAFRDTQNCQQCRYQATFIYACAPPDRRRPAMNC
jgi:hypothetical protein